MEETVGHRISFDNLPAKIRGLITDIKECHRANKLQRLRAKLETCREVPDLRHKYAELIELMTDSKPSSTATATHFRIARTGDVVFINNHKLYGQTFKRLSNLHLPLC